MLETRTLGGRMEGSDESTELWQHTVFQVFVGEFLLSFLLGWVT